MVQQLISKILKAPLRKKLVRQRFCRRCGDLYLTSARHRGVCVNCDKRKYVKLYIIDGISGVK